MAQLKDLLVNGDSRTVGRASFSNAVNQILVGTGTAAQDKGSGVSPRYFPAKWTFNIGSAAADGDIVTIKIPVAGHDYGVFMSVDGGANYYPIVCNGTGRLTTHYGVNTYITVIFEPTGSAASMFPLNGGDARVTVSNGVFRVINYYDSNSNDIGYYVRRIYPCIKAGSNKIFPYTIIMQNKDGRWESLVTSSSTGTGKARNAHGFLLGNALVSYVNSTFNENGVISNYNLWSMHSGLIDHRYSFNTANDSTNGTTANKPIYIVGAINASDGLFYLDSTKWWTQTLPSSDDGKLYIYIGDAYDYYRMTFVDTQRIYWYKNGKLREYAQDAATVTGHTVAKDVPSNALFTDNNTTYTFANGTNGFTVTPSGGSAQTVTVTPSISNNVTGSGTSGYLTKFNGGNTITNGPQLGSSTTTYLRNNGTWENPQNVYVGTSAPSASNYTVWVDSSGTISGGNSIVDLIYPVGSIYISVNGSANPATLFGRGTWEKIEGKFLLGSSSTYTSGSTGGEASHVLTVNEMPAHDHSLSVPLQRYGNGSNTAHGSYYGGGMGNSIVVQSQGGSQGHNNMPPYLVVNIWKRTA